MRVECIEGDRCQDAAGNVGRVLRCLNRTTREYYLRVRVDQGALKGTWHPAWKFTPVLDHDGGTMREECERCARPFKATVRVLETLGGYKVPKETLCATCITFDRRVESAQRSEGYVGSEAKKVEHHSR